MSKFLGDITIVRMRAAPLSLRTYYPKNLNTIVSGKKCIVQWPGIRFLRGSYGLVHMCHFWCSWYCQEHAEHDHGGCYGSRVVWAPLDCEVVQNNVAILFRVQYELLLNSLNICSIAGGLEVNGGVADMSLDTAGSCVTYYSSSAAAINQISSFQGLGGFKRCWQIAQL